MTTIHKYGLPTGKTLLTIVFLAAGLAKLAGLEMMVETFEAVGVGQWLRYVTGVIEVGSVILLWVSGWQFVGSVLLVCTMIGAALAHLLILGPSVLPAVILGVLAAITAYAHRDQASLKPQS